MHLKKDMCQWQTRSSKVRTGRKRKAWEMEGSLDLVAGESLPAGARRWLREHDVIHKPLAVSSKEKARAYLADCGRCLACSKQYCFSLQEKGRVCVEKVGECSGDLNVRRVRLANARKYGATAAPAAALKEMVSDEVPASERPNSRQLQNQRPTQKSKRASDYSVDCLGALRKFVERPPDGVHVEEDHVTWRCPRWTLSRNEHIIDQKDTLSFVVPRYLMSCCASREVTITEDQVRVPFQCSLADAFLDGCGLTSFLMDFTFNTNKDSLVLGAIGPCGLHVDRTGPHVRFVPIIFLLAEAEDEEAHGLLVRLFLNKANALGTHFTDAYLDLACFHGAARECARRTEKLFLHRCLEHVKRNVRFESGRRCSATGKPRLRNTELADVVVQWLEFTAWLPSTAEFTAFWASVLARMKSNAQPTDFGAPWLASCLARRGGTRMETLRRPTEERAFRDYLEKNILMSVKGGLGALWQYGLGSVPVGFTTYSTNAIERSHRMVKGMIGSARRQLDVGEAMVEVCRVVQARLEEGYYTGLLNAVSEPWPALDMARQGRHMSVYDALSEDMATKVHRRLDRATIVKHWRQHGPRGTYLASTCKNVLADGRIAKLLFVMPKFALHFALEKPDDMAAALALGLANSVDEVRAACQHADTQCYDLTFGRRSVWKVTKASLS